MLISSDLSDADLTDANMDNADTTDANFGGTGTTGTFTANAGRNEVVTGDESEPGVDLNAEPDSCPGGKLTPGDGTKDLLISPDVHGQWRSLPISERKRHKERRS